MDQIYYCLLCGNDLTYSYTYRMCNNCTNTYCSECCRKQIHIFGEKYVNNICVLNQCNFCHIYKSEDLFFDNYEFKMFDIPYQQIDDHTSILSTNTSFSDTSSTDTSFSDTLSTNSSLTDSSSTYSSSTYSSSTNSLLTDTSSNTEHIVYDTQILDYILWKINKTRKEIVEDMFEENIL